jgi:hypothetical protein
MQQVERPPATTPSMEIAAARERHAGYDRRRGRFIRRRPE